jgi:hypothetical protein
MKTTRKHFTRLSLFCALALGATTAARADSGFQFGFWAPNLQIVDANESVSGLRINIVYGENANVSGADFGIVNSTTGNFKGVGWGPGANLVKGSAVGVQFSAFYSHTAGEFTGWQSGAVSRIEGAGSRGLQTALVSLSEGSFSGVQTGFFNKATTLKGLQFGVFNWAENLDGGLQIGLINYAANSDLFKVLPIVNWQF